MACPHALGTLLFTTAITVLAHSIAAVLVWRTDLYHRYITPQCSATVQFLGLAESYRDIVRVSALDARAHIRPYEKSLVKEYSVEFRVCVGGWAFGVQVMYPDIFQFSCFSSAAECFDQYLRCACNAAEMDVVSWFDGLYSFIGRNETDIFSHKNFFGFQI